MPTTEKIIYHDKNGVATKIESTGTMGAWGGFVRSYELKGGKILFSWYADHTCSDDCWDKPINNDEVPDNVKDILGQPTDLLQAKFGNEYVFQELVTDPNAAA